MVSRKSVFVSYSGRIPSDKDFAKRLLVRLCEHFLDPWVFEQRGGEVPLGENVDEYCRKKIRQADLFVAIISESSLESESTRSEVAFALKFLDPREIIQISTAVRPHDSWDDPYRQLTPYKRIEVIANDSADLERCIEDICCHAGINYLGPNNGSPRLPLISRLTEEVKAAKPRYSRLEVGIFSELRLLALHASQAYEDGRLEHAFSALTSLEYQLSIHYEGQAFYYPRLIRGVLLFELSAFRSSYLNDAMTLFCEILEDRSIAALVDENLYAAMATVYLRRGEINEALRFYYVAHEMVKARGRIDPDLIHNIIVANIASLSTGQDAEVERLLEEANYICATTDPYLCERLLALKAALRAKKGDIEGARYLLHEFEVSATATSDILAGLAQDLAVQPHLLASVKAVDFIENLFEISIPMLPDKQKSLFLSSYAGFLYRIGQFERALKLLQMENATSHNNPRFVIDEIWCLRQLGRHKDAHVLALAAANLPCPSEVSFSGRALAEFFYFRGFAAWLSGAFEQSRRDFLDSRFPVHQSYEVVAQQHTPTSFKRFKRLAVSVRRFLQ
ncbi:TIR domain-containing protein [Derxia lacustris]|uniref:TIR domain-containing protein n=1 Tax=Derxia lacustris TaxID=764842 RepID=UPI000A173A96|nr:TIR domain-containing protein [Derxia lacustris]